MKAKEPQKLRPVKIKESLVEPGAEEVNKMILKMRADGTLPTWTEARELDTPELDTETLFDDITSKTPIHQMTIPFSVVDFPMVCSMHTAMEILQYCIKICNREKWAMIYPNFEAVLNQTEMAMSYGD